MLDKQEGVYRHTYQGKKDGRDVLSRRGMVGKTWEVVGAIFTGAVDRISLPLVQWGKDPMNWSLLMAKVGGRLV